MKMDMHTNTRALYVQRKNDQILRMVVVESNNLGGLSVEEKVDRTEKHRWTAKSFPAIGRECGATTMWLKSYVDKKACKSVRET
jgi:hypothetical protein